uniref:Uncharacterized protein n=1 Tax=viral metagenome TaxID=1070528 RepID=A0A6M3INM2_9ZZZZ
MSWGSALGTIGGGIGGFLLGGPFGALGGAKLGNTIGQGSKGKWGIDELLAATPLAASQFNIPGISSLLGMGGSGSSAATGYSEGGMSGYGLGSTASSAAGGGTMGNIWDWMKKNPIAMLVGMQMLGGALGGGEDRKMSETQRQYMQLQIQDKQKKMQQAEIARQALNRIMAQGPFARSIPDMSDLFKGAQ